MFFKLSHILLLRLKAIKINDEEKVEEMNNNFENQF